MNQTQNDELQCSICNSREISLEGEKESYQFYRCENCEFTFCPRITPEFLTKFYANGSHGPEDGAPHSGWCDDYSFLDPVFDHLPQRENLHILDFGTGQSTIPAQLREKGHRVIAIDVAAPLKPHPDRLTGDLLELKLEPNQFDFAFSFQVFEHLPRPKLILDELISLLRPGGLLLIHTDMETEARNQNGFEDWWYVLPPDHCAYYRHKTFEVYVEDRPLDIIFKDEKRVMIRKKK